MHALTYAAKPAQAVAEAARVLRARRTPAAVAAWREHEHAGRGRGLRPRQPRASRDKELRKFAEKAGLTSANLRHGDAREAPAAFRSDLADRETNHEHDCPGCNPDARRSAAEARCRERILIIDGAMGTMIQRHDLRGSRLSRRAFRRRLRQPRHVHGDQLRPRPQGQQRPAAAEQAGSDRRRAHRVPGSRRRPGRDQHLQRHLDQPGRLPPRAPGLRTQQGRRARRPRLLRCRRGEARRTSRAS